MIRRLTTGALVVMAPLAVAGCMTANVGDVSDPVAGFSTVSDRTTRLTGHGPVWIQSGEQARILADSVHALVHGKTIGADVAVQVALMNNRGLQAAYADLGLSAADLWQETMLVNPRVAVGISTVDLTRTIEAAVISNILALMTRPHRVAIAEIRFRQAQLRAVEETLRLAAETRRAWVRAVSAWERVAHFNKALVAADAASELAKKLGETGAFTKSGQAREHVFYAELAGQAAEARTAARVAKEELTRLMGLWGEDVDYFVPNALPPLPDRVPDMPDIEAEALRNRVDLSIARLELEALGRAYGLTQATRYISDLDLMAGIEIEREKDAEGGEAETKVTGLGEIEFTIPIFDSGEARLRKAELAYMQAANRLAERAVNIRSEARTAYLVYRSRHDIARHYRSNVVPLRTTIEEESLLTYNGMITSVFELLADTRARIEAIMLSLTAKRDFWLAEIDLGTAIHGGGGSPGSVGDAPSPMVARAGAGH